MKRITIFLSLIVLLLLSPATALAQGGEGAKVHFGSDLILDEGETIAGDVAVFGGNFTMRAGSEVEGDVVVFGGNADIHGEVDGNVASLGGNVTIHDTAEVDGDVTSLGGNVVVSEEADVSGTIADGVDIEFGDKGANAPVAPEPPRPPDRPDVPSPPFDPGRSSRPTIATRIGAFFADGIQDIFWALIVSGLSVLLVMFFPKHFRTIQDTVQQSAPVSFIVGLITIVAVAAVITLLALLFWLLIPICGIVIIAVGLAVALLAGWAVIGNLIGNRIFNQFDNPSPSEISATLLGVAALSIAATMPFVDHFPGIGWMFGLVGFMVALIVNSAGLGAVVLTRFGTQEYQPGSGLLHSAAHADLESERTETPTPPATPKDEGDQGVEGTPRS